MQLFVLRIQDEPSSGERTFCWACTRAAWLAQSRFVSGSQSCAGRQCGPALVASFRGQT